jgi:hypothetical protein
VLMRIVWQVYRRTTSLPSNRDGSNTDNRRAAAAAPLQNWSQF